MPAEQVEGLAALHCTDEEIAGFFGVTREAIRLRKARSPEFVGALEKGRARAKRSLRRAQWAAVERGNVTMMIWLGKQYLDQRDRQDLGVSAGPITLRVEYGKDVIGNDSNA